MEVNVTVSGTVIIEEEHDLKDLKSLTPQALCRVLELNGGDLKGKVTKPKEG